MIFLSYTLIEAQLCFIHLFVHRQNLITLFPLSLNIFNAVEAISFSYFSRTCKYKLSKKPC